MELKRRKQNTTTAAKVNAAKPARPAKRERRDEFLELRKCAFLAVGEAFRRQGDETADRFREELAELLRTGALGEIEIAPRAKRGRPARPSHASDMMAILARLTPRPPKTFSSLWSVLCELAPGSDVKGRQQWAKRAQVELGRFCLAAWKIFKAEMHGFDDKIPTGRASAGLTPGNLRYVIAPLRRIGFFGVSRGTAFDLEKQFTMARWAIRYGRQIERRKSPK